VADTRASLGAKRLREALRPRMKASELAEKLGVTQQAINAWLCGSARPTVEHMAKLEELAGVPLRSWLEPWDEEEPSDGATGTED
jgi:transcriptional regulator with XRE-family HTH domain